MTVIFAKTVPGVGIRFYDWNAHGQCHQWVKDPADAMRFKGASDIHHWTTKVGFNPSEAEAIEVEDA